MFYIEFKEKKEKYSNKCKRLKNSIVVVCTESFDCVRKT